jgi:hypothetical protein
MPKYVMEAVRYTSGVRSATDWYLESDNQSFKRGSIVTLDGTGRVAEFTGTEDVLGVSSMDATGRPNAKVGIWLATGDAIFLGSISALNITALTDLGRQYGLLKEGGVWTVDKDEVINTRVCVVNIDSRDEVGTVNGRVLFTFLPDTRQLRF